ncbi:MAG: AgmX/PglI C-terminal domain-containing protein, partial [Deltaproteobacteria bacterium]
MRGQNYHLRFTEQMDGKLSVGDGPQLDFKTLVSQGVARRHSDTAFDLPLTDASRGKVVFGDHTLLFQFVSPPPEPARPQLPEVATGGWWRTIDRLFLGILVCSMLFHFGLISAVSGREVSDEVTLDEIPDRFAKLIIPDKPVAPPKPKAVQASGDSAKKPDKSKEVAKKAPAPKRSDAELAAAAAARHEKMLQAVAQKGLLKILGSEGGSGGGAIEDVLSSGGGNSDIASALQGAGGVGIAGSDSVGAGGHKGGGSGKAADIGSLGTAGGGKVGLGRKAETHISASVSSSAPEVESSSLDRDAVSRFVKMRIKSITNCYEKELKLNPSLKGKLAVRITIATTGRVGDIEIDEDTLHSDEVVSCIKSQIRFWHFPFTPDSDTAVQFSWNFVSSQ